MRIWLALRAFFRALLDREAARRIEQALAPAAAGEAARETEPAPTPAAGEAGRSEALTLLATLQREARFVDIVKEPLQQYSDAQIGAAARDVLRDCGAVLERLFDLCPVVEQEEGTEMEVAEGYDPGRYRVTGSVAGEPPFRGRLVHHGWQATRCQLGQWSGSRDAQMVVAPVEVELSP